MEKEEKPKTIKLSIILSLTISIASIIIISYFFFTEETLNQLTSTSIKYEFFILAIAVNFIYWIFWGVRLRILSNAIDKKIKISVWKSTKIVIANLFLANITPSMAGGEPVRIYLLNKEGLSFGSATAAVLAERLLDAIFLLLCVPFAFLVFSKYLNDPTYLIILFLAIMVFIVAILFFAMAIKYPEKIKKILIKVNTVIKKISKKKSEKKSFVEKISKDVDDFHDSMIFYLKDGKFAFFKAGLATAIFWVVGWTIPILILMGLGLPPHIIESCAAQVMIIIIVMMPTTPGSTGVTEGGVGFLYKAFIPGSLVAIFVILFRIATYYVGLIAGAIFQYRIFKSIASFSIDSIKKHE